MTQEIMKMLNEQIDSLIMLTLQEDRANFDDFVIDAIAVLSKITNKKNKLISTIDTILQEQSKLLVTQ